MDTQKREFLPEDGDWNYTRRFFSFFFLFFPFSFFFLFPYFNRRNVVRFRYGGIYFDHIMSNKISPPPVTGYTSPVSHSCLCLASSCSGNRLVALCVAVAGLRSACCRQSLLPSRSKYEMREGRKEEGIQKALLILQQGHLS